MLLDILDLVSKYVCKFIQQTLQKISLSYITKIKME